MKYIKEKIITIVICIIAVIICILFLQSCNVKNVKTEVVLSDNTEKIIAKPTIYIASGVSTAPEIVIETYTEVIEETEEAVEDQIETFYYDIPLSHEMQDNVRYYLSAMNIDLDETYIYALIYCESRFDQYATGSSGDSGYCQILKRYFNEIFAMMKNDFPELASEVSGEIYDEKTNLLCGIYYLDKSAKDMTGKSVSVNNLSAALTAYNRGTDGARSYYKSHGTYVTSYSREVIDVAHYLQETGTIPEL